MKARIVVTAVAVWLGVVAAGPAQETPLFAGNTNAILDEFDQVLQGNGNAWGDVVQILRADAGIFPPSVDGTQNTNNALLVQGQIGKGVDPFVGDAGLFSEAVQGLNRGAGGTIKVFARAFNANSLTGASFYGDSQIYSAPTFGSNYDVFVANIQKTAQPLDTGDPDGDGLNNSWEESLFGDPNNPDTDGDGMPDGPEFRAGTQVTNNTSLLLCVQLQPAGGANVRVYWDSVTGKQYRVERTVDNLDQNPLFTNVSAVITAVTWVTETVITNGLDDPDAHYRVRLVEAPE